MQPTKSPLALTLVSTAILLCTAAGPASAATATAPLNVSATVVASCTIAPPSMTNPAAALAAGPTMCRAPAGTGIVARRPQISVEHDPAVGVTRLVFAF